MSGKRKINEVQERLVSSANSRRQNQAFMAEMIVESNAGDGRILNSY